jgi:hypothetical protein
VTALIALFLAVDIWALFGWWRALRGEEDDARTRRDALLEAAAAGRQPRLRSVA